MAELKIDAGEWVVVADGGRALLLENVGDRVHPDLRTKEVYKLDDPKGGGPAAERPARAVGSEGNARSPTQQADWREHAEQRFLTRLAQRLDKAVQAGETKSLILVAPPRAIGVLRRQLSKQVQQVLRVEIEKDYVKMPIDEIARHLAA